MKAGETYFVRIDTKANDETVKQTTFDSHIAYLKDVASKTSLYGGGFKGSAGGMIVFSANSLSEAHMLCKNDPIIAEGFYSYQLHQWELVLTS